MVTNAVVGLSEAGGVSVDTCAETADLFKLRETYPVQNRYESRSVTNL